MITGAIITSVVVGAIFGIIAITVPEVSKDTTKLILEVSIAVALFAIAGLILYLACMLVQEYCNERKIIWLILGVAIGILAIGFIAFLISYIIK